MGEAPAIHVNGLQNGFSYGFGVKSKGCETTTAIGDKIYAIGGSGDESAFSIGVKVFDKSRGEWVNPIVRGMRPKPCKDHSSVLLNDDRILIIKRGSAIDDCIWFLEVDTEYVREQKKSFGAEVVAWSKGSLGEVEKPVVISGPSGVGKGTLISMLMKEFPFMFGFSVSHTTRAPRAMEKDGVHYHFTDRNVMEKEIRDGKFLEYATVHENLYGTSIEAVEVVADAGKRCILDIDVQGARQQCLALLKLFLSSSVHPQRRNLKNVFGQGTETEEQIQKRLKNAKDELEKGKVPGLFDHLLYNDSLEECYRNLKKILGLDGVTVIAEKQPSKGIDFPSEYSVSKIDNKVLINCVSIDSHDTSKNMIVLDVASIQGGAPGRTRGINIYGIDSFSELNGVNNLNQCHLVIDAN